MEDIRELIQGLGTPVDSFLYLGKKEVGDHVYQITKDVKLKVRPGTSDMLIVTEVFTFNQYGTKRHPLKSTDIVVDLGAHIGAFTVLASKIADKGHVYAYEPNPANFSCLKENLNLNACTNVSIFESAVSSKSGSIPLYISGSESEHTIFHVPKAKSILVSSMTLEDIFRTNNLSKINFLKLDVEGAEYEILLNAPDNLLQQIEAIGVEYHDYFPHKHNYGELVKYLKAKGFGVSYNWPTLIGDLVKTGNILAVKKIIKACRGGQT